MKHQPNKNYNSNDEIQTPPLLCEAIVKHFQPSGIIMEPCRGEGNFYNALKKYTINSTLMYAEINEGIDF